MRCTPAFLLVTLPVVLMSNPALAVWPVDGAVVTAATNAQRKPRIVSDGAGGVIVTWQDRRPATNEDIYAQRIDASGVVQWTADGAPVCTFPQDQLDPCIATDDAGGAIIAWHDFRDGLQYDVFAQRLNASGSPLWTVNGVTVAAYTNGQFNAVAVPDGSGGAVIAWKDFRTGTSLDVYAQRLQAANGAWAWISSTLICNAAGSQDILSIVPDGEGGAIISWQDQRSGLDIYARRVNAIGTAMWTANGIGVCTEADFQVEPVMTSDGAGGAIIAWYDYRGSGVNLYAQRIDGVGNALWTADGLPVSSGPGSETALAIVADGSGGAIIAWQDSRFDTGDIYAQRINANGNPEWFTDGMAICTAAGVQMDPDLVSDGAGGAIIAWRDGAVPSDNNIVAQRIDATGNTWWGQNGIPVCAATASQSEPVLASDGAGGAIAAWTDPRNGASDIYARRATAVPTGVGDTPRAPALSLLRIHPNPFTGSTEIEVDVPADAAVSIDVYDVAGRRVRSGLPAAPGAGVQRISFDGRDDAGQLLPSGVYFCRVGANGANVTGKMVIAR